MSGNGTGSRCYAAQPIVEAVAHDGQRCVGWELLYRGGPMPPAGGWIRADRELLKGLRVYKTRYAEPLNVNLSTFSVLALSDRDVAGAMRVVHDSPEALCLEWTEEQAGEKYLQAAAERLKHWRSVFGMRLSVDDFGAGVDGTLRVRMLEPDQVKLDGALIHSAHQSGRVRRMVRAITRSLKNEGVSVVAECVETPEDLELVEYIGCPAWQGFLSREIGFSTTTTIWN